MSLLRVQPLTWFERFLINVIKCGPIPKHIAFIMDGNRRFSSKNNIPISEAHYLGFDKLTETLQWCSEMGVKEVTVYAFSIGNFKRSKKEVEILMNLAIEKFHGLLQHEIELRKRGIHIRIIGNLNLLPDDLQRLMAKLMLVTKDNNEVFVNFACAYTSTDEITTVVENIVEATGNKVITPDCIDENLISKSLYTSEGPDPDLLIRTSGELRLSDFLLWQTSSSCIYFTKVLWPELNFWNFLSCILYYQRSYATIENVKMEQKQILTKNCPTNSRQVNTFLNQLEVARQKQLQSLAGLL
uniref:Alkyl transferase n=1 Tax=Xenopsylla cheopis TaxID=163159 RepID=A0A6M2DZ34_XENCH